MLTLYGSALLVELFLVILQKWAKYKDIFNFPTRFCSKQPSRSIDGTRQTTGDKPRHSPLTHLPPLDWQQPELVLQELVLQELVLQELVLQE